MKYKDIWISAYCRLSFREWYQRYKDDMAEVWKSPQALRRMLEEECEAKDKANEAIRVDAVACKKSMGMETCLEKCLYFLSQHENASIVCDVLLEDQKTADKYAYEYISREIGFYEYEELLHGDFVIKIRFLPELFNYDNEEAFILKENKTCLCLEYSEKKGLRQTSVPIDDRMYQEIIAWSKDYAKAHKRELVCGLSLDVYYNKYTVDFNVAYMGIPPGSCVIWPFQFEDLTGDDPISKLLRQPDITKFAGKENHVCI